MEIIKEKTLEEVKKEYIIGQITAYIFMGMLVIGGFFVLCSMFLDINELIWGSMFMIFIAISGINIGTHMIDKSRIEYEIKKLKK